MKTSTKVIIALVIVIGFMSWYNGYLRDKDSNQPTSGSIPEAAKKQVQTQAEKIADEVDKKGMKHAILKMVKEIDQSAVDKVKADLLDTVAALNIKRDELKQVMVVATTLTIKNQRLEKKITELATTYSHFDDNFRLSVNVPKDSLQAATFDAGYDADIITTQYNKGNWFTGNRAYMDIYSNDPRFTIKGARTLTVKQNQPLLAFKIQAAGQYNPVSKSIGAGAAARLDISRFSVQGNYMFFPDQNKWIPNITTSFDLIRF